MLKDLGNFELFFVKILNNLVKSDGEKSAFSYFRYFSYIDKNEDGVIDFQEIKNAYNNKIEDFEVK